MSPLKYDGSNWQGNLHFKALDLWDVLDQTPTRREVDMRVYEPVRLLRVDTFMYTL